MLLCSILSLPSFFYQVSISVAIWIRRAYFLNSKWAVRWSGNVKLLESVSKRNNHTKEKWKSKYESNFTRTLHRVVSSFFCRNFPLIFVNCTDIHILVGVIFLRGFQWRIYPLNCQPYKMVKHTQTIRLQQPTNCLSVFDHFMVRVSKTTVVISTCIINVA